MSDDGLSNMKGRNAHSLLNDDSIAAWIADNEPNGEEKLRSALELGRVAGARARYVEIGFEGAMRLRSSPGKPVRKTTATGASRPQSLRQPAQSPLCASQSGPSLWRSWDWSLPR